MYVCALLRQNFNKMDRGYGDDTLTIMPDRESADCFLLNLNDCHPSQ